MPGGISAAAARRLLGHKIPPWIRLLIAGKIRRLLERQSAASGTRIGFTGYSFATSDGRQAGCLRRDTPFGRPSRFASTRAGRAGLLKDYGVTTRLEPFSSPRNSRTRQTGLRARLLPAPGSSRQGLS